MRWYFLLPCLVLLGASVDSQCEVGDLEPDDGEPDDRFGFDLGTDGDWLLVGASEEDDLGVDAGAAYVYLRRDDGKPGFAPDDSWMAVQKLHASDGGTGDRFGHSVAVRGDWALIGANGESGELGAAYVFTRDDAGTPSVPLDDTWVEVDKIGPSDSVFRFARSLSVHGDTLIVGVRAGDVAYVFERDDAGTPDNPFDDFFPETAELRQSDFAQTGTVGFGGSVSVWGDTAVVGAHGDDVGQPDSGSVYVFDRDASGVWHETGKLQASRPIAGGNVGRDLALYEDTLLVGGHESASPVSAGAGMAYIFERDRAGTQADPFDDNWVQVKALYALDGAPGDEFGLGVSLHGDIAAVGANGHDLEPLVNNGAAYAYRRDPMGTASRLDDDWTLVGQLLASSPGDHDWAGLGLANSNDTIYVGASGSNNGAFNDDAGYVLAYALDCRSLALDFSTEDDFSTALVNGQDVGPGTEFGHLVTIDGLSASGLAPAIFDSTPEGPNAWSQDPDLLVELGNLLILQTEPGQTVPGIFDHPNDDWQGGELCFTFPDPGVELVSIDLVDVDDIPFQDMILVLTDGNALTRTFLVPSGWTRDRVVDGPPGFRTLSLATLDDQPGFVASATATEVSGFDLTSVTKLQIQLEGSGAVDNLRLVPEKIQLPNPVRRFEPNAGGPTPHSPAQ